MTAGTAAAALADLQPLVHLKHANYQLREETRLLRAQVCELLEWKERAVRHMVAQAPKRTRAQRQLRAAAQLQQKLQAVEQTLQGREELEATAQAMQQEQDMLHRRIEALEGENNTLKQREERSRAAAERSREQLRGLSDMFRVHLEKLVAVRETIDVTSAPEGLDETRSATTTVVTASIGDDAPPRLGTDGEDSKAPEQSGWAHPKTPAQREQREQEAATALIEGLAAVSHKCLGWFEEHVAASFQRQQQKAALFETQHEELLKLRAQLHATRASESPSASVLVVENHQLALEIARLQHEAQQLGGKRVDAERALAASGRAHRELTDRVRELTREVRQFLRLVRTEIRRKFGYVPEAIAHAESWARIAEALDALLRSGSGQRQGVSL